MTPLTAQTVAVNGAVYRLANPTLMPPSLTLAARVGDAAPVAALAVDQCLARCRSPNGSNATLRRDQRGLHRIRLDHRPGGRRIEQCARRRPQHRHRRQLRRHRGRQLRLQRRRHDRRAPTSRCRSQSVALTGHVYTPAVAQVNTTIVDFGIVHRGDASPTAPCRSPTRRPVSAANDTLQASLAQRVCRIHAGGTLSGLGAGATDASSLRVGLNTANAGVFTGTRDRDVLEPRRRPRRPRPRQRDRSPCAARSTTSRKRR